MIKKYLKIKPNIDTAVSTFAHDNFVNNYMIGIHYRGTDKTSEAVRTPYEKVKDAVDKNVIDNKLSKYKLFVATDEQEFLDYIKAEYSDICFQDAIRSTSGKPIHFDNQNPYRAGKEALFDALLLSKTKYLIRTSSNLSRWSTYFNPNLEVLELSQRH